MTHNIQVGVTVDDESIAESVVKGAVQSIQLGMFGKIINNHWTGVEFSREFQQRFLTNYFDKVFADPEMRELIAEKTAEKLAEKLGKSKTFKAGLTETLREEAAEDD